MIHAMDKSGAAKYPKQSWLSGKRLRVHFGDPLFLVWGKCVRSDEQEPYMVIVLLDDGRFVTNKEVTLVF